MVLADGLVQGAQSTVHEFAVPMRRLLPKRPLISMLAKDVTPLVLQRYATYEHQLRTLCVREGWHST